MGADEIKTFLSGISVVIALVSLGVALQSRSETRRSAFASTLEILKIKRMQNANHARFLDLRATALVRQLIEELTRQPQAMDESVKGTLRQLEAIRKTAEVEFERERQCTAVHKPLSFSSGTSKAVRNLVTTEEQIGEDLQWKGYDAIFTEAGEIVERLRKGEAADLPN